MEARGRRLSWWMGGVAAAGVLATHWLTYRLVVADHHRADVLHDTGHAHLPVFSAVALALFTASSLRVCALGWRGRALPRFRATAGRLAVLQAVAWVAVEVGERALVGRLATVDDHAVLLVGLAVQLAVAVVAAAVFAVTHRALAALGSRRDAARPPRARSVRVPTPTSRPHRLPPLSSAVGLRGPPPPLPLS